MNAIWPAILTCYIPIVAAADLGIMKNYISFEI